MYDNPRSLRSADRLRQEFGIALEYGSGNIVFSTLDPLINHQDLRETVKDAMTDNDIYH